MADLDLHGGTVADGTGSAPRSGSVRIRAGRFIGPASKDTDIKTLDVTGCTVLPGLIDAHSHLGLVGNMSQPADPWAVVAAQIFQTARGALDAGFTTVRDLGGLDGGFVSALRSTADDPHLRGPRILPSGPIISEAGGNGDLYPPWSCCGGRWDQGLPGLSTVGAACRGPDDVRAVARLSLRRGATQLKVSLNTLQALESSGADTEFGLDELRVAVAEAHAKRTYVTGHATNSDGIRLGLAAGVECFEHGGIADEEVAGLVAAAGAPLVPTLTQLSLTADDPAAPAPARAHCRAVLAEMQQSLLLATEHGITVGLGSDLEGVVQIHRGSELVRRAALQDPMTALVAATSVNARIIRRPDLGGIKPGAVGDVIAIKGDPLADPGLFDDPASVVLVVTSGIVVKNLLG